MQKIWPKKQPEGHAIHTKDGWQVVDVPNVPSAKLACWSMVAFIASIIVLVAYVCLA